MHKKNFIILSLVLIVCASCTPNKSIITYDAEYTSIENRKKSPEKVVYYINPQNGDDVNSGTSKKEAWKSFIPLNHLILAPGCKIEILASGDFSTSLHLMGEGTSKAPISINFGKGQYSFTPENAFSKKFNISNTNQAPDSLKAIAFYYQKVRHLKVNGNNSTFLMKGKMMETCIDSSENISIKNLTFDYERPTVSEMFVEDTTNNYADIKIHEDSKYSIKDSMLFWEGNMYPDSVSWYWQILNPANRKIRRAYIRPKQLKFVELEPQRVRIYFDKNPGFKPKLYYQNRNVFRDYAAIFMRRSKDISWQNTTINFMHGMGMLSQFCENVSIDSLTVKPNEEKGRHCAAWADILHFSGCKGQVSVTNSYLSSANDDAINVHGTHLRIVDTLSSNKIKVRFMHRETFGFSAFVAGDSVEFIGSENLLPYAKNKVKETHQITPTDFVLELENSLPAELSLNDALENTSWTPDVLIKNNTITQIPTRGILLTTRGKVVVEDNEFHDTHMSAILIADDANSWYESGYVRDVTIRNNKFLYCGNPVIKIHPENKVIIEDKSVHRNISILNNTFKDSTGMILAAKSTGLLRFNHNNIIRPDMDVQPKLFDFNACPKVQMKENYLNALIFNQIN